MGTGWTAQDEVGVRRGFWLGTPSIFETGDGASARRAVGERRRSAAATSAAWFVCWILGTSIIGDPSVLASPVPFGPVMPQRRTAAQPAAGSSRAESPIQVAADEESEESDADDETSEPDAEDEEGEQDVGDPFLDGFGEGFEADGVLEVHRAQLRAVHSRTKDNPQIRAALGDVVHQVSEATLCVHVDGKHVALGAVVGTDGWVVTKASPLRGKVTCRLRDERRMDARIAQVSGEHDLALLKINASGLKAISLESPPTPGVGSFVASVGKERVPIAVGVVSVAVRQIPRQFGVLGVDLDHVAPKVTRVAPDSGAAAAGVQVNDLIVKVNERDIATRLELQHTIRSHNPGDEVTLAIQRAEETIKLQAILSGEFPGRPSRIEFQNNLGGKLSVRRFGFPRALQHDTVLRPIDCGGPVVNLDGQVVGINIARAGRTETYALPIDTVASLVKAWLEAQQAVNVTK